MFPISARWIQDFEKHLYRRQHFILYSNIHDQFLWQGSYQNMVGFLNSYFLNQGFDLIVHYDPIDGLTFPQPEMRQIFEELARQRLAEQQLERLGQSSTPTAPTIADPMQPPSRANPGTVVQRLTSSYQTPEVAFSQLRAVLSQSKTSVVAIADLGKVTVLLPLSPSFRKVISTQAGATGCATIPVANIQMQVKEPYQQLIPEAKEQKKAIIQPNRCSNYQERLPGGSMLDMIAIPSGTFFMGTATEDIEQVLKLETWFKRKEVIKWLRPEMPQHRVSIPALYMSRTPISQEQWQVVMQTNPSHFSSLLRPVESISWWQAQEFCDRLSQLTGKSYRLPSEAEWEYASRAGTQTLYSFGNSKQLLRDYAWYTWNSRQKTQLVGQKKPNIWGLQDMHGLVWEWCEDNWHENYNGAPNNGKAWVKDGHQTKRVVRGGSWYSLADDCRCVYRFCYDSSFRYSSIGFRVVASGE